jgi:hypothetical protein
VERGEEADQNLGDVTSQRRTSHGLGAEIEELMHNQERNDGNSLEVVLPRDVEVMPCVNLVLM